MKFDILCMACQGVGIQGEAGKHARLKRRLVEERRFKAAAESQESAAKRDPGPNAEHQCTAFNGYGNACGGGWGLAGRGNGEVRFARWFLALGMRLEGSQAGRGKCQKKSDPSIFVIAGQLGGFWLQHLPYMYNRLESFLCSARVCLRYEAY